MITQTQTIFDYTVITVITDDEIIYFFQKGYDWWSTHTLEELYVCIKSNYCSAHFVGQYEDVCKWINERSVFGEVIEL